MTETPRPDPWAQVRTFDVSTYGDCRMERDYYGDITSEQTHQRGEYAWVDEVDAARAALAAQQQQERNKLVSNITQVALKNLELRSEIAILRQERDAAIDENIRLTNAEIEALSARCATLEAALDQKTRWADFLGNYLDGNHESHGSDMAWNEFIEKEHETPPVTGCKCAQCRAAAAPQGEKS